MRLFYTGMNTPSIPQFFAELKRSDSVISAVSADEIRAVDESQLGGDVGNAVLGHELIHIEWILLKILNIRRDLPEFPFLFGLRVFRAPPADDDFLKQPPAERVDPVGDAGFL